jgi:hypothetical protein
MLSWVSLLISIALILLGAHGLYAYFHPLETLFSGNNLNRLFFAIDVPSSISGLVIWMTLKGFQSFFIPGIFLACGIGLFLWAKNRGFHVSLPHWTIPRNYNSNKRYSDYQSKNRKFAVRPAIYKITLSLAIIAGIVILVWFGNRVFTHETKPLVGAITFLFGIAILITFIWLLRRKYIWYKPSFKLITLAVIIIAFVFAFAGVEPLQTYKDNAVSMFSGKFNNSATNNVVQRKTTFNTGGITWEVTLTSFNWSGERINTQLVATNKGNRPADFPYENVDPIGVVVNFGVIDTYGLWYGTDGYQNFDVRKIYPGESRTFKPSFIVNSRSGDVTLYVTRYTGTSKFPLFKLESPNKQ